MIRVILVLIFSASSAFAESYRIGVILPLTGVVADYGVAIQRSIEIAKDQDRVDLIYVWGVSFCKALAPLAESSRMPVVGQCIDPESSKNRKFFIRFQNYTDQYMEKQTKILAASRHKKLALLVSEHPYPDELLKAFKKYLEPGQEIVLVSSFPMTEMDFRSQIIRLKNMQIDSVGVFLMPGQIAAFYRQIKELRYNSNFFGTNLFESDSEVKAAGEAIKGTVFVGHNITKWFEDQLKSRYGDSTQLSFSGLAYDFAVHFGKATDKISHKVSGLELLRQIKGIQSMNGEAAGQYLIKESKEAGTFFEFELVAKTVK